MCFLFSVPLFRLRVNSTILRGKRRITLQVLISCFQNSLFRRLSGILSPTHWFGVIYNSHRKRHRCSKLSRIVQQQGFYSYLFQKHWVPITQFQFMNCLTHTLHGNIMIFAFKIPAYSPLMIKSHRILSFEV